MIWLRREVILSTRSLGIRPLSILWRSTDWTGTRNGGTKMVTWGMFFFFFLPIVYIDDVHPIVLEGNFPFTNITFYIYKYNDHEQFYSNVQEAKMWNLQEISTTFQVLIFNQCIIALIHTKQWSKGRKKKRNNWLQNDGNYLCTLIAQYGHQSKLVSWEIIKRS